MSDPEPKDPTKPLLPPINADYEISAIIMKAIAPNPEDRWASPMEMGQALVGYMQRNSINNTPLSPNTELVTDPEAPALVAKAASQTKVLPNIKHITSISPVSEAIAKPIEEPEQEPEVTQEEPAVISDTEEAATPLLIPSEGPEAEESVQNREDAIAEEITQQFISAVVEHIVAQLESQRQTDAK